MEVSCALGVLLYCASRGDEKTFYKVPGLLPLGLFLGWMLIQAVTLPAPLVKLVSPASFVAYQGALGPFGDVSWMPLSVAPGKTLAEFFRFSSYVLCYWLTVQLLSDRKRLKKTVFVVAGLAAMMAVYAIVETLFTNGKIYGFYSGPAHNTHVGPYVYHNHYAGFMGLVFPLVVGLYLYYRPRARYGTWRERLVEYFSGMGGHLHVLLGFAAILMGTSVFLSLSRGGIISLCLSMLCLIGFFSLRRKESSRKPFLLMCLVLITLSVSWFGWEPIVARFDKAFTEEGELTDGRFLIWEDSAGILRDFPFVGTGFGTFGAIYPTYRTLLGEKSVGHAHNDYLELVSSGGLVGFFLVAWFLVALFHTTWGRYKKRRDPYAHCLYLGAVAGLLSIFFHSVVDFNFYNNANGLIFFFVCGLAVSASHTRLHGEKQTFLGESGLPYPRVTTSFVVLFLVTVAIFQGGTLWAGALFDGMNGVVLSASTPEDEMARVQKIVRNASFFAPLNPKYPFILARISARRGDHDIAEDHLIKALRLCPVDSKILQFTARYLCRRNQPEKGRALFEQAITHDVSNPERYKMCAGWLLGRGEVNEGVGYIQKAMALSPSKNNIRECVSLLLYHDVSKETILELMPERVSPRFVFADIMARLGDTDFSRDVIVGSIDYIKHEEHISPWFFTKVYWVYMKEQNYDMALSVLQNAAHTLSDDARIHILAGDTYLKMGIHYRAVEEYKQALIIDPKNSKAKTKLDRLSST